MWSGDETKLLGGPGCQTEVQHFLGKLPHAAANFPSGRIPVILKYTDHFRTYMNYRNVYDKCGVDIDNQIQLLYSLHMRHIVMTDVELCTQARPNNR